MFPALFYLNFDISNKYDLFHLSMPSNLFQMMTDVDPAWEYNAPQFVDFSTPAILDIDDAADKYFGMLCSCRWRLYTLVTSALRDFIIENAVQGKVHCENAQHVFT